ncbi:DegT/DnrJ/EryC1/StrS aminotransferase family protein [Pseudonocardia sp. C8]|nr:DegT/DnrJ/EryC1/StrS aminotransferase family protein [Pseudonocardia sp. C8]MBC3193492.1 DegT/DnrJ/EryC1/StrS aminotransferase family protein [Pseudonocardia sp. C8]
MPGWPHFEVEDAATVSEILLSGRVNYWTGEQGRAFEAEFARWAGARHAVAMANGTVALEIALRAIGVGPGTEVVVPAATFIATASAVVACGGVPVVVDVDPDSQALTPATVEPALTRRTRAVVAVHVGGYPADTAALARLTADRGIDLVEDCAQAHGARRAGLPVGTHARIAAWSFCQDKIMSTAGEGGAVTTSDDDLARRCWSLKDHGKDHAAVHGPAAAPGFRWLHTTFGTNARMTEIQAAVGRRQLHLLAGWVARRREHACVLRDALGGLPALRLPRVPDDAEHAYYRFYAHVRPAALGPGWDRDRVVAAIVAEGVPCAFGGCTEIYRERAFDRTGRPAGRLPVARELGETSLVLPVHPTLSADDVGDLAAATRKVLAEATA